MKRFLPFAILALLAVLAGCKSGAATDDPEGAKEAAKSGSAASPGQSAPVGGPPPAAGGGAGNNVNITPMGGVGAGPMTPVAGAEGVQGGGSAVGQVMKDKAKGVAAQPPSSVNQMGGDEN